MSDENVNCHKYDAISHVTIDSDLIDEPLSQSTNYTDYVYYHRIATRTFTSCIFQLFRR